MTRSLLAAALIGACAFTFTACGGGNSGDQAAQSIEIEKARAEAAAQQKLKDKQAELDRKLSDLRKQVKKKSQTKTTVITTGSGGGSSSSSSSGSACGGNVSAGANTSCAFAQNVASEYFSVGGGNTSVSVYSPVTHQTYVMTCTAGAPTVCRGGNNASVYIR